MTSGGFSTDPGQLRGSAPRYGAVATALSELYQTLTTTLEVEGACWGSDDFGRAFAAKYVPPALTAIRQISGTTDGVQSMVDGICSWARNYVQSDAAATDDAGRIGG